MPEVSRIYTDTSLFSQYQAASKVDYYRSGRSDMSAVENAVVLPCVKRRDANGKSVFVGGVIDAKGKFFTPSAHIHSLDDETGSLKQGYEFDCSSVVEDGRTVIYGGILYDHFGHSLVESLNRLWYVLDQDDKETPVVFLTESGRSLCPQIADMFSLLKLDGRLMFITRPIRFAKVIVPGQSGVLAGYYTDDFLRPFDAICAAVEAKPFDKVYLSRRRFKGGIKIYGEDKLEKTFKANGFKVIYPERLSLREQISYIKGAKEIASVMGSATHLSLFAKEGTKNIVLERTEHINKEQILINQARKLDWRSVSANMNYLPVGHEFSPILLGVTDYVAAFFKDGQMRFVSRDVNRISDGAIRHFCRAFFARYSSGKYNPQIEGLSAVYAKRTALFCKTAFLSLRQRLFMKRSDGLFRIYTIFGFSFKVRRRKI